MFSDKIDPIIYNGVVTIGIKDLITKHIIAVSWSFDDDDERQLHTNKFTNILYISD